MRAALINNYVVENIVEVPEGGLPEDWVPGKRLVQIADSQVVAIGWFYDKTSGSFSAPPEPLPVPPSERELLDTARDEASRMIVLDSIISDTMGNAKAELLSPLFPELDLNGVPVEVGEVFRWNGTLVQVIQAHTTQPDWTPEATPALFKLYRDIAAGPQPWVQPQGAHDAYVAGSTVTHNGQTWVNTHGDGNVWEPGVYGWVVQ